VSVFERHREMGIGSDHVEHIFVGDLGGQTRMAANFKCSVPSLKKSYQPRQVTEIPHLAARDRSVRQQR